MAPVRCQGMPDWTTSGSYRDLDGSDGPSEIEERRASSAGQRGCPGRPSRSQSARPVGRDLGDGRLSRSSARTSTSAGRRRSLPDSDEQRLDQDAVLPSTRAPPGRRLSSSARAARSSDGAYSEFTQHFPQPGWVEHDADEIWRTTVDVCRDVLAGAGQVAAIGITNQRETVLVWDRETGQPVHRAIVWQDRRTADRCQALRDEGAESLVRERTGLLLDPYFSGTKIAWILDNVTGARARAEQATPRVRHRRHLPDLAPDRGRRSRHGCHQRVAHPALRHPRPGLGRRAARAPARAAAHAARGLATAPRSSATARPDVLGSADGPHRGHRRRPAGGARRSDLLRPRHGKKHLRHRLLPADEHRRHGSASPTAACSPPARLDGRADATPSRAPSSSPGPPSSGCATGWAS